MIQLFQRRTVWLPTWPGLLLMLAVAGALAMLVVPRLGDELAPNALARGADGRGARTLVVEGWLDDRALDDALVLAAQGRYARILTSGGPIESWRALQPWPTYADRAADYLRQHGAGARGAEIVAVPTPAVQRDRSYRSAVAVRDWLRARGAPLDALDLASGGVHARRSRLVYRLAFGDDVEIGIAALPRAAASTPWWHSSEDAKAVVGEVLSLAWTTCCFWPSAPSPVAPAAAPASAATP